MIYIFNSKKYEILYILWKSLQKKQKQKNFSFAVSLLWFFFKERARKEQWFQRFMTQGNLLMLS